MAVDRLPERQAHRSPDRYAAAGQKREAIEANPNVTKVISMHHGDGAGLAAALEYRRIWERVIAQGTARIDSEDAEPIAGVKTYMAKHRHGDYWTREETDSLG